MTERRVDFRACDTTWRILASGRRPTDAVRAAKERVLELERRLNAFDPRSAVSRLNRDGAVTDPIVAALVRRAQHYRARTEGAFDIANGSLQLAVKAYIRGARDDLPASTATASFSVEGDAVRCSAPLDLNGIAKGYIVDEAHAVLVAHGCEGFVDGGGDIAAPTGCVAIESPYGSSRPLGILDTRWNIATSGGAKRRRGTVEHLYDPRSGRVGSRHDQVTVVARRDCTEADVLATTLAVLPLAEGKRLLSDWEGAEAMWVDDGEMIFSRGFEKHVWHA